MSPDKLYAAKHEFLAECNVVISENERENFEKAARKGIQAAQPTCWKLP